MACQSAMQVCLIFCWDRARFDTSPKREANSCGVSLFLDLLHVVSIMFTKSWRLLSSMLSTRFLMLMCAPRCALRQEHEVLKHLSMDSELRQSCKSGFPKSIRKDSMLQANTGLSYFHTHASKFSSNSIELCTGPCLLHVTAPFLIMPSVAWTKIWGYSSASFGSFMRSMRAVR